MTLIAPWILFPVVLTLVSVGCGLLLEQLAGQRMPGPLLPPAGFAVIIVVGQLATASDSTAELATPLALGLALAGFALALPWRRARPDGWEAGAALGVFAVFAAPIVLSGAATFAGYIKLDDTATWMAFTDWVMQHGPHVHGLAPSSYEATLGVNLPGGYPIGAFLGLGVGRALTRQDVAWVIQPYMALMAAMVALILIAIGRPLLQSSRLRGVAAFIAAQSALLFGYSLWGGVKELVGAVLIALVAASVPDAVRGRTARATIPLAVSVSALLAVSSVGAVAWLLPLLAPALVAAVRRLGAVGGAVRASALAGGVALLALPPLLTADNIVSPTTGALVSGTELGNLIKPLNPLQIFGIWPVGDFRLTPGPLWLTYLVIALAAVAACSAIWRAIQERTWGVLLYCVGVAVGCGLIVVVTSPWVGGKALASASPAVLFAAAAGGALMLERGNKPEGFAVLAVIGAAVITSNVLAYGQVNLAPRGELAELQTIGTRIAGQGPTFMTDDQIYGARHFLRNADPEGVSQLRRRQIHLRDGSLADKPLIGGTDAVALPDLLLYKTIVIRRGPATSRPPLPYQLTYAGRYYDVWQRADGSESTVIDHLPLGSELQPAAVPRCADVLNLARRAGPNSRLVAARPRQVTAVALGNSVHPTSWVDPQDPGKLIPSGQGEIEVNIRVRRPGVQLVWLGGSVRAGLQLLVDGAHVGSVRHQLTFGSYVLLGQVNLGAGLHQFLLRYSGADLHPGSANTATLAYPIGPIALGSPVTDAGLTYVDRSQAAQLCGKPWDWIEAIRK